MAIEIDGVTLSDIPEGVLDTHPYWVIMDITVISSGDRTRLLVASSSEIGLMTASVGNQLGATIFDDFIVSFDPTFRQFMYDATSDGWTEITSSKATAMDGVYAMFAHLNDLSDGKKYRTVWANHDIRLITSIDLSTGAMTFSEDIWFGDSTIAQEEAYAVPGAWLKSMGDQIRRVAKAYNRHTYKEFLSLLDEHIDGGLTEDEALIQRFSNGKIHFENGSITTLENSEVTSITAYQYAEFTNFTGANFANVTEIESYAFVRCANLRNIDFPNVSTIGNGAFNNSGVVKADLPKASSIGLIAFAGCSNLETVILRNTEAVCGIPNKYIFRYTPIWPDAEGVEATGYIYVPSALLDAYKADTYWSTYAAQFRAIEDYPDICGTT